MWNTMKSSCISFWIHVPDIDVPGVCFAHLICHIVRHIFRSAPTHNMELSVLWFISFHDHYACFAEPLIVSKSEQTPISICLFLLQLSLFEFCFWQAPSFLTLNLYIASKNSASPGFSRCSICVLLFLYIIVESISCNSSQSPNALDEEFAHSQAHEMKTISAACMPSIQVTCKMTFPFLHLVYYLELLWWGPLLSPNINAHLAGKGRFQSPSKFPRTPVPRVSLWFCH